VNPDDVITNISDISRLRSGMDAVKSQLENSGTVMLMLGPFMFSLDTAAYQSFHRRTRYKWSLQDVAHGRPVHQWGGPGEDTIELRGVIYPEYYGGLKQVNAMREIAGLGKPLLLVDGLGFMYDEWVIRQVEEKASIFYEDGQPKKIEFHMELDRYKQPSSLIDATKQFLGKLPGA